MPAVGLTFVRSIANDINVPIYETKSGSVVVNENMSENIVLDKKITTSITFNITEASGYPLVYCSVGDYSCGTRGYSTNPVSIASELNGKTIDCNAGDQLIVAAQTKTSTCVDLTINGDCNYSEVDYNEQTWYTVVEGPQTLTIKTSNNGAPY